MHFLAPRGGASRIRIVSSATRTSSNWLTLAEPNETTGSPCEPPSRMPCVANTPASRIGNTAHLELGGNGRLNHAIAGSSLPRAIRRQSLCDGIGKRLAMGRAQRTPAASSEQHFSVS